MQPDDIQRYCDLMAEIKARTKLVKLVGEAQALALPRPARVEFVYLQLRKIVELIAMASLLANAEMFVRVHSRIQRYRNAKDLLREIEALNPEFYPTPVIQMPSEGSRAEIEWADRPDDFLTKDRFISLYDKCGSVLHASNPFAPEQDLESLEVAAPKWYLQIMNLLNAHTIRPVGDAKLYLIQMGNDAQRPTCSVFTPQTPTLGEP